MEVSASSERDCQRESRSAKPPQVNTRNGLLFGALRVRKYEERPAIGRRGPGVHPLTLTWGHAIDARCTYANPCTYVCIIHELQLLVHMLALKCIK